MVTIRSSSIIRLNQAHFRESTETIASWLLDEFPRYFRNIQASVNEIDGSVSQIFGWSRNYKFSGKNDIAKLAIISLSLGWNYPADVRFRPAFLKASRAFELANEQRLELILESYAGWFDNVVSQYSMSSIWSYITEQLDCWNAENYDVRSIQDCMLLTMPKHWANLSDETKQIFVDQVLGDCKSRLFSTSYHRAVYAIISIPFGLGWYDDKKLNTLRRIFETAVTAETLFEKLAIYFEEGSSSVS